METIKAGKTKHRCHTPGIDPNWMWDRPAVYKNNQVLKCTCGKYYLIKTENTGSSSPYLYWKHLYGPRLWWHLFGVPKNTEKK